MMLAQVPLFLQPEDLKDDKEGTTNSEGIHDGEELFHEKLRKT